MDLKLLNLADKEINKLARLLEKSHKRNQNMIINIRGEPTNGMSYAGLHLVERFNKELGELDEQ